MATSNSTPIYTTLTDVTTRRRAYRDEGRFDYFGCPVLALRSSRRSPKAWLLKSNMFDSEPAYASNESPPIKPLSPLSSMKRRTKA